MADLKTAIENAAVAAGWTLTSDILSKGGCFFQLVANQVTNPYLRLLGGTGQSGSTLTGQPAQGVQIASAAAQVMVFPINYEIYTFSNPDEIYCVVNYNSDFYQQLSFGKSDIPGIGGTGAWLTGTYSSTAGLTHATFSAQTYLSVSQTSWGNSNGNQVIGGFFLGGISGGCSSLFHCGLDSVAWRLDNSRTAGSGVFGCDYCASLITALPNISNQATILLPIKGMAVRFDGGRTIVANPKNARYMRNDNVVPGEIITFGADKWKCYPFFRKDATVRNGISWTTGAQHSGTFGYAIRYNGS